MATNKAQEAWNKPWVITGEFRLCDGRGLMYRQHGRIMTTARILAEHGKVIRSLMMIYCPLLLVISRYVPGLSSRYAFTDRLSLLCIQESPEEDQNGELDAAALPRVHLHACGPTTQKGAYPHREASSYVYGQ